MAAITICSDFGAPQNKLFFFSSLSFSLFPSCFLPSTLPASFSTSLLLPLPVSLPSFVCFDFVLFCFSFLCRISILCHHLLLITLAEWNQFHSSEITAGCILGKINVEHRVLKISHVEEEKILCSRAVNKYL